MDAYVVDNDHVSAEGAPTTTTTTTQRQPDEAEAVQPAEEWVMSLLVDPRTLQVLGLFLQFYSTLVLASAIFSIGRC